jgi:hypothetical protein
MRVSSMPARPAESAMARWPEVPLPRKAQWLASAIRARPSPRAPDGASR